MGLACWISRDIDKITDESKWEEYRDRFHRYELEYFHKAVEQRAYFAAEQDHFKEKLEVYWNSAKASVVLEIIGELDAVYSPRFKPSEAMPPLDKEDVELIYSVMKFSRIQTNLHRTVDGKVKDYICGTWFNWLKRKSKLR